MEASELNTKTVKVPTLQNLKGVTDLRELKEVKLDNLEEWLKSFERNYAQLYDSVLRFVNEYVSRNIIHALEKRGPKLRAMIQDYCDRHTKRDKKAKKRAKKKARKAKKARNAKNVRQAKPLNTDNSDNRENTQNRDNRNNRENPQNSDKTEKREKREIREERVKHAFAKLFAMNMAHLSINECVLVIDVFHNSKSSHRATNDKKLVLIYRWVTTVMAFKELKRYLFVRRMGHYHAHAHKIHAKGITEREENMNNGIKGKNKKLRRKGKSKRKRRKKNKKSGKLSSFRTPQKSKSIFSLLSAGLSSYSTPRK